VKETNGYDRAGVRQLAALFIVFKSGSSSGGPGICPLENFRNSSLHVMV